jgi:hypothetical protein
MPAGVATASDENGRAARAYERPGVYTWRSGGGGGGSRSGDGGERERAVEKPEQKRCDA